MGLTDYKLGNLIVQIDRRNTALRYGIEDVRGVSNTKEIRPTKANVDDRAFDKFYIVEPKEFVFNRRTTRNGERLGLGFNNTDRAYIFTEDYIAFTIKESAKQTLLPEYLYLFFLRDEFDRYVRYNSWGSATEFFNWEEMCGVPILLPDLPVQQKAVDAYNAINANFASYADGLKDLKTTCQAYIEKLAKEYPLEAIGDYIEPGIEKNTNEIYCLEAIKGISTGKVFIETKANMEDVSLKSYLLVRPQQFAFVPDTSRRGEKIGLAFNNSEETNLISSIYQVFKVKDPDYLVPEYLFLWLSRPEFDRYARYNSWGSAREVFSYFDLCKVRIPIPPKPIQQSIVDIYHAQFERQEVAEFLNKTLREICPILIRQSLTDET